MLATPIETIATAIDAERVRRRRQDRRRSRPGPQVGERRRGHLRARARPNDGCLSGDRRGAARGVGGRHPRRRDRRASLPPAVLDRSRRCSLASRRACPRPPIATKPAVTLVAFDLLADESGSLVDRPWAERRARLERFVVAMGSATGILLQPAATPSGRRPLRLGDRRRVRCRPRSRTRGPHAQAKRRALRRRPARAIVDQSKARPCHARRRGRRCPRRARPARGSAE